MHTTGIIHTSRAFHIYTGTGNNLQCTIIHGASPCFNLPLLILLCSPLLPFLLTWNPPSCARIRPPQSQVACELTSPVPPFSPTPPPSKFPEPLIAQHLTKTTSGPVWRLLSGTVGIDQINVLLTIGTHLWLYPTVYLSDLHTSIWSPYFYLISILLSDLHTSIWSPYFYLIFILLFGFLYVNQGPCLIVQDTCFYQPFMASCAAVCALQSPCLSYQVLFVYQGSSVSIRAHLCLFRKYCICQGPLCVFRSPSVSMKVNV